MSRHRLILGLVAGCAFGALATTALADPPSRVGRISYVEGGVAFQPPQEDDWSQAVRNFPVTSGEAFWTGDDGRTELEFGPVQARLDQQTELDVVSLDYGEMRLSMPQGSMDLRLWRVPRGGVSISTPAGEVRVDRPGAYRIDVGAAGEDGSYPPVEVTAIEGDAQAPGPGGFVDVQAGAAAVIYAGYDPDLQDAQDAPIDDWARQRETQGRFDGQPWVPVAETGYEDLDAYGDFQQTPDYGEVWFPRDVPQDWAPYRYGRWSYVNPWGWTWIDDQPWGFAPFHYGRWAQVGGRWGWVPGQPAAEPVYAPALVAFIGGGGVGIGLEAGGGGGFGWTPLAPDEAYVPPYRVSNSYVRQVNSASVNQTIINNITVNNGARPAQLRNAAATTVVRADAFARGAPVQQAAVHVSPQAMTQALAQARSAPAASAAPPPPPPAPPQTGGGGPPGARQNGAVRPPGMQAAAPPPARVQQLRQAVAQQAPGSNTPPVIPGVHQATQKPQASPQGSRPQLIAPSQAGGRPPPSPASPGGPAFRNRPPQTPASPPASPPGRPMPNQQGPTAGAPDAQAQAERRAAAEKARADAQAQAQTAQAQARQAEADRQAQAAQARARNEAVRAQGQAQPPSRPQPPSSQSAAAPRQQDEAARQAEIARRKAAAAAARQGQGGGPARQPGSDQGPPPSR